ncbi:hypothetical protein ACJJTC_008501 [Scirpophaga incertulas]
MNQEPRPQREKRKLEHDSNTGRDNKKALHRAAKITNTHNQEIKIIRTPTIITSQTQTRGGKGRKARAETQPEGQQDEAGIPGTSTSATQRRTAPRNEPVETQKRQGLSNSRNETEKKEPTATPVVAAPAPGTKAKPTIAERAETTTEQTTTTTTLEEVIHLLEELFISAIQRESLNTI